MPSRKKIITTLLGDAILLTNFNIKVKCMEPLAEECQKIVDEYVKIICL